MSIEAVLNWLIIACGCLIVGQGLVGLKTRRVLTGRLRRAPRRVVAAQALCGLAFLLMSLPSAAGAPSLIQLALNFIALTAIIVYGIVVVSFENQGRNPPPRDACL